MMRPDVFIASCKRNADWARSYSKRVRIEIIPHGVDLEMFKPEGKKRKVSLARPIILCVAGADRYKRVEETIRAVAKLEKASLLLVGSGLNQEKLGKRLLGKRFKRIASTYEQLPQAYRVADMFTMVSESSEEFGIVNLEALASGLVVVGTDDGLRREILGPHGVYVKDPTDIDEYAEKLRQGLKRDKKRPEKWLERFSWNKVAADYINLFKRV